MDGGRFEKWGQAGGLISSQVYSMDQEADEALWFGTARGIARWKHGQWTHWRKHVELADGVVNTVAVDAEGGLWFGDRRNGLGRITAEGSVKYFTTSDGLVGDAVWEVKQDRQGVLWYATSSGLGGRRNGTWFRLGANAGMPDEAIWPIDVDGDSVCVGTLNRGLVCINRAQGEKDLPQVHIKAPQQEPGRVRLSWTAHSLWGVMPEDQIETRYRLNDRPWSDWSLQRQITLEEPGGGEHHLQVQAKGMLGNFQEAGARLMFAVEGPFYFRPTFQIPVGAALLLAAGLAATLRRRKQLYQRSLAASEARFRALIENSWDAIALLDAEGRRLYMSPFGRAHNGLSRP